MSTITKVLVILTRALLGLLFVVLLFIFTLKEINFLTVLFSVALFAGYWWLQQFYLFSAAFLRKKKYYKHLTVSSGVVLDRILQYCRYDKKTGKYVFVWIDELNGEPTSRAFFSRKEVQNIYGRAVFLPWK